MHQVEHIVRRFPGKGEAVRRLYLRDERFRAICEDLVLAEASLLGYESRPDSHLRPEVDDYRVVLRELEDELSEYLTSVEGE